MTPAPEQTAAAIERVVNAARALVRAWDEFGPGEPGAVGEYLDPLIDAVDGLGDAATGVVPLPGETVQKIKEAGRG